MSVAVPGLDKLLSELNEAGARRHATWDGGAFALLARRSATLIAFNLQKAPERDRVLRAFLELGGEALARGYFSAAPRPGFALSPSNLIEALWLYLLPSNLHRVQTDRRINLMAELWNIGEGLLSQPAWLNQVVAASAMEHRELPTLATAVERCLEENLSAPAGFPVEGRFETTLLDLSHADEDFLPGEMHFSAPPMLCVHDRLRSGACLGVLFRKGGPPRVLPTAKCLGKAGSQIDPGFEFRDEAARLGAAEVKLPRLLMLHRTAASAAGAWVASAVDSQRLWVARSE